jgi:hypothetical protein
LAVVVLLLVAEVVVGGVAAAGVVDICGRLNFWLMISFE